MGSISTQLPPLGTYALAALRRLRGEAAAHVARRHWSTPRARSKKIIAGHTDEWAGTLAAPGPRLTEQSRGKGAIRKTPRSEASAAAEFSGFFCLALFIP
jgi:hypothetical protein